MKKVIFENFKPFRMKIKPFLINSVAVLSLGITSCGVQNQFSKDEFKRIPKNFSVSFYDKCDTITTSYDGRTYTRSLMKDFTNLDNIDYLKPITLRINKTEMFLKFSDTHKKHHVLKFCGKLQKRKFIFYTNYQTVSFPILFMSKQMTKYTIYISDENEIVFDNQNTSEGMLLLFGAGTSSRFSYKFKLLKNE